MPGMHGTVAAVGALQQADLLIAVGTRFDDRVTGKLDSFAPLAKVIHCDVDPAEISKNRVADLPVVGDAKAFLRGLVGEMSGSDAEKVDCKAWAKRLTGMKAKYPLREGRVQVREVDGKPGAYQCTVHLRPHFQLDQLSAGIRLTTQLAASPGA